MIQTGKYICYLVFRQGNATFAISIQTGKYNILNLDSDR